MADFNRTGRPTSPEYALYGRGVLRDAETPELKLKAVHAMQQAVSSYVRLIEASELEERLTALEEAERARQQQPTGLRR